VVQMGRLLTALAWLAEAGREVQREAMTFTPGPALPHWSDLILVTVSGRPYRICGADSGQFQSPMRMKGAQ